MTYDASYFEYGTSSGISCYENYRWQPERTMPLAQSIVDFLGLPQGGSILDYGTAKGFLVKALRRLGIDAYGCDISPYAIEHCDPEVVQYVRLLTPDGLPFDRQFDAVVAKDVLEHMQISQVLALLTSLKQLTVPVFFVVVPLAVESGGKYVLPESELDVTHNIRETLQGWESILTYDGWRCRWRGHRVAGIGEHHTHKSDCVGFLVMENTCLPSR